MDNRLIFLSHLMVVIRWGDAEGYRSRVMDVPIGMCKPDPAGKSTGSFNGETCDETTRSQSPGFHAAWKNL
jgi:hypothetical protein